MKVAFTFKVFEILLFECRSVFSPAQRGTRSERVRAKSLKKANVLREPLHFVGIFPPFKKIENNSLSALFFSASRNIRKQALSNMKNNFGIHYSLKGHMSKLACRVIR